MATVQAEILSSFYSKLAKSADVDRAMIDELRALFDSGKKLKAEDFAAILVKGTKGSTP